MALVLEAQRLWPLMTEAEREELGAVVADLERQIANRPLAYATLWDNPRPRTSQRRCLVNRGTEGTGIFGGNGSGKTELGAQYAVAVALGRHHADAIDWCRRNGLDATRLLPPYAGRVLASSLTSNESRRVLRKKVKAYCPPGTKWRNETGDGEAEAQLPGGGVIVFKSNDQKARAYQSDEFDVIWLDEEHDEDVYDECLMRLGRRPWKDGQILLTMTPLKGLTWVHRLFVREPGKGTRAHWIHGADNPYLDQEKRLRLLSKYGAHERAARERGEFVALEGRVYPMFARDLHEVDAFVCPAHWPRFEAIDWGTSVPTCILLSAYDANTDTVHVYGEVYRAGMTIADRAAAIRGLEAGGPAVDLRLADPEDASTNMSLVSDFDIGVVSACKAVRYGINVVATRLQPDVLGRPHVVFHRGKCPETLREIEGYVWMDGKDAPMKRDDHAMDTLRYLLVGISQAYGLAPAFGAEDEREAA